jgi:hypothetical protein
MKKSMSETFSLYTSYTLYVNIVDIDVIMTKYTILPPAFRHRIFM